MPNSRDSAVVPPQDGNQEVEEASRLLAVTSLQRRAVPHLGSFFPEQRLVTPGAAVAAALRLESRGAPRAGQTVLQASAAPWRAAGFGRRRGVVALVAVTGPTPGATPWVSALTPPHPATPEARAAMALLREARVGGAPDLPDPGWAGLGRPRGEALVVLDPGQGDRAAAAIAALARARAGAAGRPVLVAISPDAPRAARPTLPATDAERLPGRLAPWTLIDLAHALHGIGETTSLLGLAAGIAVHDPVLPARAPVAIFAALLAATRCADPFRARPWSFAEAMRQLADWRVTEAENRRIVATVGIEWFKHRAIRAALASGARPPRILARGGAAIRVARRRGGALAVWSAAMPASLPARAAAAGVPLMQIEDGFLRSVGLGVRLAPALSFVLDARGIHYDPATASGLEVLLTTTRFDAGLLARAAALRAAVLARGLTKYNLPGAAPALAAPPGRRTILVPGQVEDDAAIRRGGARLRTNLELLRAVRGAAPAAWIAFKPHPDVAAGLRAGAVPATAVLALADQLLDDGPIAPLYDRVDEVHTIASLAGFEALLRGRRVVTWGRPFYAGWGLTEDRDPPPRRGRPLCLDALVAGALILYPRYLDPNTGLPCPPEVAVERLAAAAASGTAPQAGRSAWSTAPRALLARASRTLAAWWAKR